MYQLLRRPEGRHGALPNDWLAHSTSDQLATERPTTLIFPALRAVRIVSWLAVSACLGLICAKSEAKSAPEIHNLQPPLHMTSATTCDCATGGVTIS